MTEESKRKAVEEILREKPESRKKVMKLIFDGKQFSVRIPQEFTDVLKLEKGKYFFEFELILPSPLNREEKPKLVGELKDA